MAEDIALSNILKIFHDDIKRNRLRKGSKFNNKRSQSPSMGRSNEVTEEKEV